MVVVSEKGNWTTGCSGSVELCPESPYPQVRGINHLMNLAGSVGQRIWRGQRAGTGGWLLDYLLFYLFIFLIRMCPQRPLHGAGPSSQLGRWVRVVVLLRANSGLQERVFLHTGEMLHGFLCLAPKSHSLPSTVPYGLTRSPAYSDLRNQDIEFKVHQFDNSGYLQGVEFGGDFNFPLFASFYFLISLKEEGLSLL